jgi:NAD+ kinase
LGLQGTKSSWHELKNTTENLKRVGLVANAEKPGCAALISRAAHLVRQSGRIVLSDPETARVGRLTCETRKDLAQLSRAVDLLLVFGGDGTILRVARQIAGSRTPVLGVNTGRLGFLTALAVTELAPALRRVWVGGFKLECRVLIEATYGTGEGAPQVALNDLVISRGSASRLIELEVKIDGEPLTSYRCDGLIISSPTGSTAYALAAGGAVVLPTADVLQLTPICPHTLSNRSLVVPSRATIQVKVMSEKVETILSADGQVVTELRAGEVLTIRRSRKIVRLMHLTGTSFCETLRRKLHWRGATF